jgi:hypothetical protein
MADHAFQKKSGHLIARGKISVLNKAYTPQHKRGFLSNQKMGYRFMRQELSTPRYRSFTHAKPNSSQPTTILSVLATTIFRFDKMSRE